MSVAPAPITCLHAMQVSSHVATLPSVQDTASNVLSLCNQLSQNIRGGCYVDASYETFSLDASDIPAAFRVPEAVQGIEFWPSQPHLSTEDHYNLLDRASSEDLLKAGDLLAHRQKAFHTANINDAYMLALPPSSVTACTVPCEEFHLLGGTVVLGVEGCMVLNGRGDNDIEPKRQRIQDVTIKGTLGLAMNNSISSSAASLHGGCWS